MMRAPGTNFMLCVTVIGFSGVATAHVGPTFYAQQVNPATITVDGLGNDAGWNAPLWDPANTITTELLGGSVLGDEMRPYEDWDVVLKVGWSTPPNNALYFYCKVRDDVYVDEAERNGDAWRDDSLEILVDANHDGGSFKYEAVPPRGTTAQMFGIRASARELYYGAWDVDGSTHCWLYGAAERAWMAGPPWTTVAVESPTGRTNVTYGYEGRILLWDVGSDTPETSRRHFNEEGQVIGLTFQWNDVDGGEDRRPDLLGTQGKEGAGAWEDASQFTDFVLIPTGCDLELEPEIRVWSVAFSPDGRLLATARYTTVSLWNVAQRTEMTSLEGHTGEVLSVAFSPDGTLLASASSDNTVRLWDIAQHQQVAVLQGHTGAVRSVAFSPDGKLLASASSDKTIRLWDVGTRSEVSILRGHTGEVYSVAFSPDGRLLASGGKDGITEGVARLWDVAEQREMAALKDHAGTVFSVFSVAFSPDGKLLASGNDDGTMRLWDVAERRETAVVRGHVKDVRGVTFSPDGRFLASGGGDHDSAIRLWDVVRQEESAVSYGNTDGVYSVAFSPDGRLLAAGGSYSTILWWDMQPTAVEEQEQHTGVSLLPTSYSLAQSSPNPFNAETTISYDLPEEAGIRLVVYDLVGRTIRTLADDLRQPGRYTAAWDGRDGEGRAVASGVYVYSLQVENLPVQTRKMLLLR